MLGAQLFLNRAAGFLHWGFNFYNTQLSKATIDPYVTTDAGGAFPSGDSFIVYAKKEEVNPSLRLFTMREAIDDYYALKQMESVYGFAFCKQFLKKYGFEGYIVPTLSSGEFLQMRKEINGYLLTKRH